MLPELHDVGINVSAMVLRSHHGLTHCNALPCPPNKLLCNANMPAHIFATAVAHARHR